MASICIALSLRKRKSRSELVECLFKVSGGCTTETISDVKGDLMKLSKYMRPFLDNGRNSLINIQSFIFFPFPFSENYIEILKYLITIDVYFLIWRCRLNFFNDFNRNPSCILSLYPKLEICLLIALVLLLATQVFVHV